MKPLADLIADEVLAAIHEFEVGLGEEQGGAATAR